MDSDDRGLRAPECYHSGLCILALADGYMGARADRDLYPGEQSRPDAEYAAVLNDYSSARGRGWGYTPTDGRLDEYAGHFDISSSEGVFIRPAHRLADF